MLEVGNFQNSLRLMHNDVSERISIRLQCAVDIHNTVTNIITPSFMVGAFFMVCIATKPAHRVSF